MGDGSDTPPSAGPFRSPDGRQNGLINSQGSSTDPSNSQAIETMGMVTSKVRRFKRDDVQSPQPDEFSFGRPEARPMNFQIGATHKRLEPQAEPQAPGKWFRGHDD